MSTSPTDPYAALARRLGGQLTRRWTLHGGVSAKVQALELLLPDGTTDRVVVRQHGAADWKPLEDGVTSTEYALLEVLADAALPVPRPRLCDLSGLLLPAPYLVLPFIDGAKEPATLSLGLERMADFLAQLHGLEVEALALPAKLTRRDDPVPELLEYLPDEFEALRPLLQKREVGPKPRSTGSVLHGDFWPGNILWQEDRIAAVLDWEDAAVGAPLSDLACSRAELMCAYDEAAMDAFTAHYLRARGQPVDPKELALWELLVSSGALAFMDRWGLEPRVEAARRSKTRAFLERAAAALVRSEGRQPLPP
jgi:aminoglycoside phosphotransferase (APT) family kinase protein